MQSNDDQINVKFEYPSVDTLRRLFTASDAFMRLAPWRLMGDREAVAVRDPRSDRIAYCVVMGMGGEYFGLDAMLGDRGLVEYRKTIVNDSEEMELDFVHRKDSLTVLFESRDMLTPEDFAVYKLAGVTYPNLRVWPQFRRFEPSFFPWIPDEVDALFMAVCLEQVVDVAMRALKNPSILGPRDHKTFLARIPIEDHGRIVWNDQFICPQPLERIIRITLKTDQAFLGKIFGAAKKTGVIWEADCFWGITPVRKSDERPRYPFCYLIAEQASGFILHANLVYENGHGANFLNEMCAAVKNNGIFPIEIHIRHPHLLPVFAPFVAFGITTKIVKKLPMINEAREAMFKEFESKAIGYADKEMPSKQPKKVKLAKVSLKNAVYQFKVTLNDVSPSIWRRVQVRGDITLKRLAATLLVVMGWANSHLHQFRIAGNVYGMPLEDLDEIEDTIDEATVLLCDLDSEEIKQFLFIYDFGDSWDHEIVLEEIVERQKGIKYPICLAGKRCCPPEDCGGAYGYKNFLKVINNPKDPEHAETVEWAGGDFDSEWFNLDEKNFQLRFFVRKYEKAFDGE